MKFIKESLPAWFTREGLIDIFKASFPHTADIVADDILGRISEVEKDEEIHIANKRAVINTVKLFYNEVGAGDEYYDRIMDQYEDSGGTVQLNGYKFGHLLGSSFDENGDYVFLMVV